MCLHCSAFAATAQWLEIASPTCGRRQPNEHKKYLGIAST